MSSISPLPPNFIPVESQSVQLEHIMKIRRPDIIYTENYLDDPIRFNTSQKLIYDSSTEQLLNFPIIYERDIADFLVVETKHSSDSNKKLMISMRSPIYNRRITSLIYEGRFKELTST